MLELPGENIGLLIATFNSLFIKDDKNHLVATAIFLFLKWRRRQRDDLETEKQVNNRNKCRKVSKANLFLNKFLVASK